MKWAQDTIISTKERVAQGCAALFQVVPGLNQCRKPYDEDNLTPFKRWIRLSAAVFIASASPTFLGGSISISGHSGYVSLPSIQIIGKEQRISSSLQSFHIINPSDLSGWMLQGEVHQRALEGSLSGERIPATFKFESIAWVRDGNGSTAGININADGSTIEASPGFGVGTYKVSYRIDFEVPAFPSADRYYGVVNLIAQ